MVSSMTSSSSSPASPHSPDQSKTEVNELRTALSSLLEDEKVAADVELKQRIASLQETIDGGESAWNEVADFITSCATSEAEHRQSAAFAPLGALTLDFFDSHEECSAALKTLTLTRLQSGSKEALEALLFFVLTMIRRKTADHNFIERLLTLKVLRTRCEVCTAEEEKQEEKEEKREEEKEEGKEEEKEEEREDEEGGHICPLDILLRLTIYFPEAIAGNLPALVALFCEATQETPALAARLANRLSFVARRCHVEARQAFDAIVDREEAIAPCFALALLNWAPRGAFSHVEKTAVIGRFLASDEPNVRANAAMMICTLDDDDDEGQQKADATSALLPQLLQLEEMDLVLWCLGALARNSPAAILAKLPTVLDYCDKAVKKEDVKWDNETLRETLAYLCKSPNLDRTSLQLIIGRVIEARDLPSAEEEKEFQAEDYVGYGKYIFGCEDDGGDRSSALRRIFYAKPGEVEGILLPIAVQFTQDADWAKRRAGVEMVEACAPWTEWDEETEEILDEETEPVVHHGSSAPLLVTTLISLLSDQHPIVRDDAIGALLGILTSNESLLQQQECVGSAITGLISVLQSDAVPRVGAYAARTLAVIIEEYPADKVAEHRAPLLRALQKFVEAHLEPLIQEKKVVIMKQVATSIAAIVRAFGKEEQLTDEEKALTQEIKRSADEWAESGEVEKETKAEEAESEASTAEQSEALTA